MPRESNSNQALKMKILLNKLKKFTSVLLLFDNKNNSY